MELLGISITEAAARLGITRKTLPQLVNGHMGISAEMAVRLSKALNTSPELWLNMQRNYDLWIAEGKMHDVEIRRRGFVRVAGLCWNTYWEILKKTNKLAIKIP